MKKERLILIPVLFLLVIPIVYSATTDGMTGYWNFEECSGDIAFDTQGTYLDNGSFGSTASYENSKGGDGTGICSVGTDDGIPVGVSIADSPDVSLTGSMSIVFWLNTNNSESTHQLVTKGDQADTTNDFQLRVEDSNKVKYFGNAGGNGESTFDLDDNTWLCISMVIDADQSTIVFGKNATTFNNVTSFTNGAIEGVKNLTFLGRLSGVGASGKIDNVGIWNRSIEVDEVVDFCSNGIPLPPTPTLQLFTIIAEDQYDSVAINNISITIFNSSYELNFSTSNGTMLILNSTT